MDRTAIVSDVRDLAAKAAAGFGFEFVHAEIGGTKRDLVIRIFIDKPGGITLDDCAKLSQDIEGVLDSTDMIPGAYVLEVSSPGIERELYSQEDFRKFAGKSARIKTQEPVEGKKLFKGRLIGIEGGMVSFEDKTAGIISIPYENVAKANLLFDLAESLKGGSRKDRKQQ
ncbi:MAG: ribosome maturation factor RimP [Acidobacteria bacterium]|nr:ribosome maturation factor RimP [Acidobacteriota bacterium]